MFCGSETADVLTSLLMLAIGQAVCLGTFCWEFIYMFFEKSINQLFPTGYHENAFLSTFPTNTIGNKTSKKIIKNKLICQLVPASTGNEIDYMLTQHCPAFRSAARALILQEKN